MTEKYEERIARERIARIHNMLAAKQIPAETRYVLSKRNFQSDDELREFLLRIHEDSQIATFVRDRKSDVEVYDPNPDEETAWYLCLKERDGKVDFVYRQPVWGVGRGGRSVPFELIDGRFYATRRELLDLFPDLNASQLEKGIEDSFR